MNLMLPLVEDDAAYCHVVRPREVQKNVNTKLVRITLPQAVHAEGKATSSVSSV